MITNIKEVYLEEEKKKVIDFLASFNLILDKDINKTFYIEDEKEIVGTISISDYIIKDLAVSKKMQGENIANLLVSHVINYFASNQVYNYQVFTKKMYKDLFISMNFHLLVETEKLVMLEGGVSSISNTLSVIKKQLDIRFAELNEKSDLACIVINGNPLTIGHEYLIKEAAKNHLMVVVFIVEEDKSLFSFKERFSMAYLTCHKFSNVMVIPSTKYIVSSLTFPTYFLKNDEIDEEMAKVDALIFNEYFMKYLFIKKRYIGSEESNKMSLYNKTLKEILKDKIEIIPRFKKDEKVVSASTVRLLLKEGKINEALELVPNECHFIIKNVFNKKEYN